MPGGTPGLAGRRVRGQGVITDEGLVLASLNLHGGRDRNGVPFDVEGALRALEADVIVIQEAWSPAGHHDPLAAAARAFGHRAIHADLLTATDLASLAIADDTTTGRWGLALLTALPVTSHEVLDLGVASGDVCHRVALVAMVALPGGKTLRIASAHLTHRFPRSVGQLRLLAAHLGRHPAPTVIAGDLNMPGPATLAATGYARAVRGRTFPSHRPVVALDHMLTGPGVTALGGEVAAPVGSDHLPIRAHLHIA